jgi:hypothetical protein
VVELPVDDEEADDEELEEACDVAVEVVVTVIVEVLVIEENVVGVLSVCMTETLPDP